MMVKLANVLGDIEAAYASYRFNSVYRIAYDFVNDLSAVYMDVTKDRLYSRLLIRSAVVRLRPC